MNKDRLLILLPVGTKLLEETEGLEVTHMQIKRNDQTKRYELRFFMEHKLLGKDSFHNMTINVMTDDEDCLSMHFSEGTKKSHLGLSFEKKHDVLRIKKYVDTLLI